MFEYKNTMLLLYHIVMALVTISYRVYTNYSMSSGIWFHVVMTMMGIAAFKPEYLFEVDAYILYPPDPMPNELHCLYAVQTLYHIVSAFYDTEGIRSRMMQWHHWTTLILVCVSWACKYLVVGAVIMLLHDASDAPLYVVRSCRALLGHMDEHGGNSGGRLSNSQSVVVNMIMWPSILLSIFLWFSLRLVGLSYVMLRLSHIFQWWYITYWIATICLSILWFMHVYWFMLMLSKIKTALDGCIKSKPLPDVFLELQKVGLDPSWVDDVYCDSTRRSVVIRGVQEHKQKLDAFTRRVCSNDRLHIDIDSLKEYHVRLIVHHGELDACLA